MAKISLDIEVVNNALTSLKQTVKQVKALTTSVNQNQKAQSKVTTKTREEIAARKRLAKAIRDQRIDKELAQLEKKAVLIGLISGAISKQGKEEEKRINKELARLRKLEEARERLRKKGDKAIARSTGTQESTQQKEIDAAYKQRAAQIKRTQAIEERATKARVANALKAEKTMAAARDKAVADAEKALKRMEAAELAAAQRKRANIEKAAAAAQRRAAAEIRSDAQVRAARAKGFQQAEKDIALRKKQDMDRFAAAQRASNKAAAVEERAVKRSTQAQIKSFEQAKSDRVKAEKEAQANILRARKAAQREYDKAVRQEVQMVKKAKRDQVRAQEKAAKKQEASEARRIKQERAARMAAAKEQAKLAEKRVKNAIRAAKEEQKATARTLRQRKQAQNRIRRGIEKRRRDHEKMINALARKEEKLRKEQEKSRITFSKIGKAAMRLFFIFETLRRVVQTVAALMRNMFAEPLKEFAEFEKGLAEVSTLLGKDIKDAANVVPQLTDKVKDLAIQFGKSPVDMAKALYFAVSSGATTAADAQEVLRVSTMLSTAGLIDAETSTRALVTVMNAYGIEFTKAEAVSDLFFVTVQKGITTVGELATKIGRVSGIAASAGIDIQTMFAFIAAGTKVTGLTTATITGLRSTIQLLLKPGKDARETFQRLNIEFGSASLKGKGLEKFITTLRNRFRGLTDDGKPLARSLRVTSQDLAKMLPNLRAQAVVLGLVTSKTNLFKENLELMSNSAKTAGATVDAVNKIMDTLDFKMSRAKTATNVLQIEFGQLLTEELGIKGFFDGVTDGIAGLISSFRDFTGGPEAKKFDEFMKALGKDLTFFTFDVLALLTIGVLELAQAFQLVLSPILTLRAGMKDLFPRNIDQGVVDQLERLSKIAPKIKLRKTTILGLPTPDVTLGEAATKGGVTFLGDPAKSQIEQARAGGMSLIGRAASGADDLIPIVAQLEEELNKTNASLMRMSETQQNSTEKGRILKNRLNELKDIFIKLSAARDRLITSEVDPLLDAAKATKRAEKLGEAIQRVQYVLDNIQGKRGEGPSLELSKYLDAGALTQLLGQGSDTSGGGGGTDKVVKTAGIRARALDEYLKFLFKINEEQQMLMMPDLTVGVSTLDPAFKGDVRTAEVVKGGPVRLGRLMTDQEKEIAKQEKQAAMLAKFADKKQQAAVRAGIQDARKQEAARLKDVKAAAAAEAEIRKKAFMASTDEGIAARKLVRDSAARQMTAELEMIDKLLSSKQIKEVEAQKRTEEAKTRILAKFEGERRKIAQQGISAAVQGYVTEEEKAQATYDANIEGQVAAIEEARRLYAEKLAFIESNAKSEVEIELRKEQAKLEIIKKFSSVGELGVDQSKAAKKGISIAGKDAQRDKRLAKQAQQEEKRRIQELERSAEAAASTVVGLGTTLVKDLLDKETTVAQAFKNLGATLLEMVATSLAEFVIGEGIKATLIASTTAGAVSADMTRLASGMATDAKLIASNKALMLQRSATNAVSGGGALAGVGMGLGSILGLGAAAAAIVGVGGYLIGKSMKREEESERFQSGYGQRLFSKGGLVTGGTPGRDSVSAMLTPGEYVLNKPTVDAIRKGAPPPTPGRYATGGFVMAGSAAPQIVFAPTIQTVSLPTSIQNQRYYRDTVSKSKAKLAKTGRGT